VIKGVWNGRKLTLYHKEKQKQKRMYDGKDMKSLRIGKKFKKNAGNKRLSLEDRIRKV
jgi:hypothetical protein